MKHTDFETTLRYALHSENISGDLARTVRLAQEAHSQRRQHISFRRFLSRQIQYIGWKVWCGQGLLMVLFDQLLIRHYGRYFWESPQSVARMLFCLSILVSTTALPLLYRSVCYRMQEVEAATYFSTVRLLLAKLAVIGIGDVLVLAGLFLAARLRTPLQPGNLAFCLSVPFLLITAAYLYLLGHCRAGRFFAGSIALSAASFLFAALVPGQIFPLFRQSLNLGWLTVCALLIGFCAVQLRGLLRGSACTELQII